MLCGSQLEMANWIDYEKCSYFLLSDSLSKLYLSEVYKKIHVMQIRMQIIDMNKPNAS